MKLYLSSYRLGNQPHQFTAMIGANKRVAVICNAIDAVPEPRRSEYVQRELTAMADLGLKPEVVDLRDYFGVPPEQLEAALSAYGALWIRGGNVFILRKAMAASGFDQIVRGLLAQNIVYAGYSAAICAAGPTLRGVELCDDVTLNPEGYPTEVIWEGLGLIDYAIAPHHKSDHPESPMINDVVAYLQKHHILHKTLRDGEAIIVQD